MEKLLKVVALTNEREFDSTENGKNVKVKAVDIELTDGMNTFIVGATGRAADAVMKSGITAGTLINADLRFSTKGFVGDGHLSKANLRKFISDLEKFTE